MITDRETIDRIAELHRSDGIPPGEVVNVAVTLVHAMSKDGRRALVAAMHAEDPEHRRLVAAHAARAVVHAWHQLLGNPDWRAAYDSRRTK